MPYVTIKIMREGETSGVTVVRGKNPGQQRARNSTLTLIVLVSVTFLVAASLSVAQDRSGLPFDLRWGMSQPDAMSHMRALDLYRIQSPRGEVTYRVPDPSTKTTNGFF